MFTSKHKAMDSKHNKAVAKHVKSVEKKASGKGSGVSCKPAAGHVQE